MTTLAMARPNLENPMVFDIPGYDSDYDYIMDNATAEDMAWYIYDSGRECDMMEDWLGVKMHRDAALDIWDNLQEDKLERLCAKYVNAHCADGFVDWMMRKRRIG